MCRGFKVEYGELHKTGKEETSAEIRNRVCAARKIQEQRYEGTDIRTNSGIGVRQMEEFCQIGEKEEKLMRCAFSTMNLTARTYHKVLKSPERSLIWTGKNRLDAAI